MSTRFLPLALAISLLMLLSPESASAQTHETGDPHRTPAAAETYGWTAYGIAALVGYGVYALRQKRRERGASDEFGA